MKLKYDDYDAMSTEDLREMNKLIVRILKGRQKEKIEAIKDQIQVGSRVKVNHPRTSYQVFTIKEIRLKRATVEDDYGYSLNVPIALVELYKPKK